MKSFFSAFVLARFAAAEHLMPVPDRTELQGLARLLLDPFHFRPLHFFDAPALDANQMVMVRAFVLDLEFGLPRGRRDPLGQAAFFEHFQRPEDRDFTDAFAFKRLVHIVHRHMLVGVKQKIDNQLFYQL